MDIFRMPHVEYNKNSEYLYILSGVIILCGSGTWTGYLKVYLRDVYNQSLTEYDMNEIVFSDNWYEFHDSGVRKINIHDIAKQFKDVGRVSASMLMYRNLKYHMSHKMELSVPDDLKQYVIIHDQK